MLPEGLPTNSRVFKLCSGTRLEEVCPGVVGAGSGATGLTFKRGVERQLVFKLGVDNGAKGSGMAELAGQHNVVGRWYRTRRQSRGGWRPHAVMGDDHGPAQALGGRTTGVQECAGPDDGENLVAAPVRSVRAIADTCGAARPATPRMDDHRFGMLLINGHDNARSHLGISGVGALPMRQWLLPW